MEKRHFWPFAVQDYLTSRVRGRSARTNDPMLRTVYLELLCALFESGGELTSDVDALADKLLLPADEIARCLPILDAIAREPGVRGGIMVLPPENGHPHGTVRNQRMDDDLSARDEYLAGKSRAANIRWEQEKMHMHARAKRPHSKRNAHAMPSLSFSSSVSSSTSNSNEGEGVSVEGDSLHSNGDKEQASVALGATEPSWRDAAREVFDWWKERTGHHKAVLTEDRIRHLVNRLREDPGETIADKIASLKMAVEGALADPFWNGTGNDRGPLTGFENIFVHRGRARIEQLQACFRRHASGGGRRLSPSEQLLKQRKGDA